MEAISRLEIASRKYDATNSKRIRIIDDCINRHSSGCDSECCENVIILKKL